LTQPATLDANGFTGYGFSGQGDRWFVWGHRADGSRALLRTLRTEAEAISCRRAWAGSGIYETPAPGRELCPTCGADEAAGCYCPPVKIARACQGAAGCILEDGHGGAHTFDLGEAARLGLGREPLAELATRTGRQLEEAADTLRQIGNAIAFGLGAWAGEDDDLPEPARARAFVTEARGLLIDEAGDWREELSGADVIEALTLALVRHGFGPKGGAR
jgi:hypothetical protein